MTAFDPNTLHESQTPDGDVMPAETGSNAPIFPELSQDEQEAANLADLKELHHDIQAPPSVNYAARLLVGRSRRAASYESSPTEVFVEGRERILGDKKSK